MTSNWFFYFLTIHFHGRNCWNFYPNMHSYLLNDENIVLWYWSTHGRISQKEIQQFKKKYIYAIFSIYFKMLIDHLVLNGGLPGGSNGKEPACNAGDLGLIPSVGKIPWRRKWQPTPVFLPGKSHGQKSLEGYSSLGCKESDTTEWLTLFTFTIKWRSLCQWVYILKDEIRKEISTI